MLSVPTLVFAPIYSYAETPTGMPLERLKLPQDERNPQIAIPAEPVVAEKVECLCVAYLRERLGVPIKGDANTLIPNIPLGDIVIGSVVLFQYENVSHAAMIIGLDRDEMTVQEANWRHCKETIRTLKTTDKSVKGFYRP